MVSLPGGGRQRVQPIHVTELAESVCRMVEHPARISRVVELAGPQVLSYREMLAHYRAEIDKNLETIVGILNAQNERHLRAIKLQQRWNYALAAAVVVVAILAALAYWG